MESRAKRLSQLEEYLETLTPKKVVEELNKYVIGQEEAKKAVAIALRNRWRRQKLPEDLRNEVAPKNIMMIGPTGSGKTEIARRLAQLIKAPFVKVEATKYTEVGYVGRDVESMVRDLVEEAYRMVKKEMVAQVKERARRFAEERLVDYLLGNHAPEISLPFPFPLGGKEKTQSQVPQYKREELLEKLRRGELDNEIVEIEITAKSIPSGMVIAPPGMEELQNQLGEILKGLFPGSKKRRKVKVKEALEILTQEEAEKLLDPEEIASEAIYRAENFGIIFIDEIDKIAIKHHGVGGGVSREGVQRDLLPLVEGTTVSTKYGPVKTDHILFIAAGAFHLAKPSDLIPELQGRFPIRVELKPLTKREFVRILTEPKNALTRQYRELLKTEGVYLEFTDDGIERIAHYAEVLNEKTENIGARRLHTVMEKLLEDILFSAPEMKGQTIIVDAKFVDAKLGNLVEDTETAKYIL
ncbi:MAG: HslU--HslV peptidase ATPase subunit [Gammaproteobacteria bacterium]|nr:MAG: HslU--HslV peptidase ATPase subunit [Gammaproteobacteria bacterium]